MKEASQMIQDRNGKVVSLGSTVRVVGLNREWISELPDDERQRVLSMIGRDYVVEEVDAYDQPWIRMSWPDEDEGRCQSYSIALQSDEMELVAAEKPPNR